MTNDELFNKAEVAIDDLFGDMSVSLEVAIQNLDRIRGQITSLMLVLEEDLYQDHKDITEIDSDILLGKEAKKKVRHEYKIYRM